MENEFVGLARQVSTLTGTKLGQIRQVAQMTKILAINARIEAGRAGEAGSSFAVVADEVKGVSQTVSGLAAELEAGLAQQMKELDAVGASVQGNRLADLALNMIDIIDRNLYERSCDVRWWATDSAVHQLCSHPDADAREHASSRLGVILDSYTVYLDLWITDAKGTVLANARPGKYHSVVGSSVSDRQWFRDAIRTRDGGEFAVADIAVEPKLHGAQIATYATAVREGGRADGPVIGTLGIFFDWQPQAQNVVDNVRLSGEERKVTRCLLLDHAGRVIAASDHVGVLTENIKIKATGPQGRYTDHSGAIYGYALTPGYETYPGLGWYGLLIQS
jgi:hypothetical protein